MPTEIHGTTAQTALSGQRTRRVAGAPLVGIGLLVLAGKLVPTDALDLLFLPALGTIFLLWGVATRQVGLLIPGGILAGVGLGALVAAGPLRGAGEEVAGGAFFLYLALVVQRENGRARVGGVSLRAGAGGAPPWSPQPSPRRISPQPARPSGC